MAGANHASRFAKTILLVEDHEDSRDLLSEVLLDAGYAVFAVSSATSALERLRAGGVHFVITDFNLEGGSTGAWLLDTAAEEGLLDDVGALLYSALPEVRAPARLSRVLVYRKPLDIGTLLEDIERALERASCRGIRVVRPLSA